MKRITRSGLAAIVATLIITPAAFAATTTVVNPPENLNGWTDMSIEGGTVRYTSGAPEGLGQGSLKLSTTVENASKATYMHEENMALKDVTTASYWTKQYAASIPAGSASYQMAVDLDGNGTFDTTLVYEPYVQPAGSVATVVANEWQKWDVTNGQWWSSKSFGSGDTALKAGAGGPPFYTLSQLNTNYPNAKLLGIGVNVGSYNPGYVIGVDGITLNSTTYNFGMPSQEAKVPASKDDCKKDKWQSLTLSDGTMFKNQGQCVSYVATGQSTMTADSNKPAAQ